MIPAYAGLAVYASKGQAAGIELSFLNGSTSRRCAGFLQEYAHTAALSQVAQPFPIAFFGRFGANLRLYR